MPTSPPQGVHKTGASPERRGSGGTTAEGAQTDFCAVFHVRVNLRTKRDGRWRVAFAVSWEFGADSKVLNTVSIIVCGDAYIIEGQSNALATDTREQSPLGIRTPCSKVPTASPHSPSAQCRCSRDERCIVSTAEAREMETIRICE